MPPPPSLITDDYAYDDGQTEGSNCRQPFHEIKHPVGDLAIECQLDVKNDHGAITLELVKGGRQFRCRVDLTNGQAKLSISNQPGYAPVAETKIRGPGTYQVTFSNIDEQLLLWVNNQLVDFDTPTEYPNLNNSRPVEIAPRPGSDRATDFSPVGIAAEGALVTLSHVKIWRDVYYSRPNVPGLADFFEREIVVES